MLVFAAALLSYGLEVSDADTNPAQACPISATEAITAKHVPRLANGDYLPVMSEAGILRVEYVSKLQDLAVLTGAFGQQHYSLSSVPPRPGDTVRFASYKLNGNMARVVNTARVARIVADFLVLDRIAIPGSSGGCVINELGEVVGIVVKGVTPTKEASAMAWVLLVTPPWWPIQEEWREVVE